MRNLSYAGNLLAISAKTHIRIYDTARYATDDEDSYLFQPKNLKLRDVVSSLVFRDDGKLLLAGDKSGNIALVPRSNSLKVMQMYKAEKAAVVALAINPEQNTQFAAADGALTLRIWNLDNYREPAIELENAHSDYIRDLKYLSRGVLISASHDRSIKRWDIREKAAEAT